MWTTRTLLTMTLVVLLAGACTTITGRRPGQFVSDTETTGRVKTALAVAKLSRVGVDTMNGTVYLTGDVDSVEMRQRAGDVARSVTGIDNVVNNVTVRHAEPPPAPPPLSSPPPKSTDTGTVTGGPRVPAAAPPPASAETSPLFGGPIARLERLENGSATSDQGPWAAYDKDGRLVATVYAVPGPDVPVPNPAFLSAGDRPIRSVSVVPHPAAQGRQYLVVLWHVTPESATVVR